MHLLTRTCFLVLLERLSLLALPHLLETCLPPLWSPLIPLHAPCLIPLFSLTLILSHFTIWFSGQTALFLLAKATLTYLPTALSVALRPLFPFRPAQYAPSFSTEACTFLQALCWSWQHQQVCHFSSPF